MLIAIVAERTLRSPVPGSAQAALRLWRNGCAGLKASGRTRTTSARPRKPAARKLMMDLNQKRGAKLSCRMSTRDTQRQRLIGRRVLVVENEYLVVMEVSDALRSDGAEIVGPAVSVAGAMDLVGAEEFDAAVLDLSLYDGMIYPVVDALTARAVPIVFTTGYPCKDILEQYRHIPCLEKPVDPEEIIRAIADTAPPQLNAIRPA